MTHWCNYLPWPQLLRFPKMKSKFKLPAFLYFVFRTINCTCTYPFIFFEPTTLHNLTNDVRMRVLIHVNCDYRFNKRQNTMTTFSLHSASQNIAENRTSGEVLESTKSWSKPFATESNFIEFSQTSFTTPKTKQGMIFWQIWACSDGTRSTD